MSLPDFLVNRTLVCTYLITYWLADSAKPPQYASVTRLSRFSCESLAPRDYWKWLLAHVRWQPAPFMYMFYNSPYRRSRFGNYSYSLHTTAIKFSSLLVAVSSFTIITLTVHSKLSCTGSHSTHWTWNQTIQRRRGRRRALQQDMTWGHDMHDKVTACYISYASVFPVLAG